MKRKLLALLSSLVIAMAVIAPVTAQADGSKVVTLGADLTEEQRTAVLKYFGILGQSVQTLTITNQDERDHLGSYVPLEQIGTRTFSCALVNPTGSGGIQVKTANLNWVTGNMIATTLSTSGVSNCQVLAAAPFPVSGTGALTGIIMAYEGASGSSLDPVKKALATEELITTGTIADQVGQDTATSIVNEIKIQVIEGQVVDPVQVEEIVDEVVDRTVTSLSEEDRQMLDELAKKIAEQQYNYEEMKETLERVEQNTSGGVNVNVNVTNNNTQENNNNQTADVSNDSSAQSASDNANTSTEENIFDNAGVATEIFGSDVTTSVSADESNLTDQEKQEESEKQEELQTQETTDSGDGIVWNETTFTTDGTTADGTDGTDLSTAQTDAVQTEPVQTDDGGFTWDETTWNDGTDVTQTTPADTQEPVSTDQTDTQAPEASVEEPQSALAALSQDSVRVLPGAYERTDDYGVTISSAGSVVLRIAAAEVNASSVTGTVTLTDSYGNSASITLDGTNSAVRALDPMAAEDYGWSFGQISSGTEILVLTAPQTTPGSYTIHVDNLVLADASGQPLSEAYSGDYTTAYTDTVTGLVFEASSITDLSQGKGISGYVILDGLNAVSASIDNPADGSVIIDNLLPTTEASGFYASLNSAGTSRITVHYYDADGMEVDTLTYELPILQ